MPIRWISDYDCFRKNYYDFESMKPAQGECKRTFYKKALSDLQIQIDKFTNEIKDDENFEEERDMPRFYTHKDKYIIYFEELPILMELHVLILNLKKSSLKLINPKEIGLESYDVPVFSELLNVLMISSIDKPNLKKFANALCDKFNAATLSYHSAFTEILWNTLAEQEAQNG